MGKLEEFGAGLGPAVPPPGNAPPDPAARIKIDYSAWIARHLKLDVSALASGPVMQGKTLGAEFVGEQDGGGWRAGKTEEGKQVKTRYFDAAAKAKSRVTMDAKGRAEIDGGVADGDFGYVVDPATGNLHTFTGDRKLSASGDAILYSHHSSPLAGGPVAGAGDMSLSGGHITKIDDRSGHYRPDGALTFQAVRQINLATLTDEAKAALQKRVSTLKQDKEDVWQGEAESPDTLAQVVSAEIGKLRDRYFAELDAARDEEEKIAGAIEEKDAREKAIDAIDSKARALANQFRDLARQAEARILQGQGPSPLIGHSDLSYAESPPELKELGEVLSALELSAGQIEQAGGEAKALRRKAASLRQEIEKLGYRAPSNRQTKVTLLGKDGAADGATPGAFAAGRNAAVELRAQQFLQTGGNEAQIRLKQALNAEIKAGKPLTSATKPVSEAEGLGGLTAKAAAHERDARQRKQAAISAQDGVDLPTGPSEERADAVEHAAGAARARMLRARLEALKNDPDILRARQADLERKIAEKQETIDFMHDEGENTADAEAELEDLKAERSSLAGALSVALAAEQP